MKTFSFDLSDDTPELTLLAGNLLGRAGRAEDPAEYLGEALRDVMNQLSASGLVVAVAEGGRWQPLARVGADGPLPTELLGEVSDREAVGTADGWAAVPMASSGAAETLAARANGATSLASLAESLVVVGPVLSEGLRTVRRRQSGLRRIERLEALLQIAQQWNQSRELEPLLTQMAEVATRLFGADRASIFLWDRPARTLVGRPALGVENGELRIPDDRGVVGQVVRTGLPRRVGPSTEPESIDHKVDQELGYQTDSLLCVPLKSGRDETIGAFELINKLEGSFSAEDEAGLIELAAHAGVALQNVRDREQLLSTSRQMSNQAAEKIRFIGKSQPIDALRSIIQRVADTDLAVLILGENGTGKEVVAQSIHYQSSRREKPFVAVNCAAIPDALAESELFGHEKGAFTDAQQMREGKFELAADGTLFLDEIGDLSLAGQSKLLRVIEERIFVRVGGSTPIRTEARVLAATNQNLLEMVREKRFREDLYFRLNVVVMDLPPLRERPDDIMLLAEHFLHDFCAKARREMPPFTADARKRLEGHPWPGNIRELRNLMERLAYLSTSDRIEADEIAFILAPKGEQGVAMPSSNLTLSEATEEFQIEYIKLAIERAAGSMSQTAENLGLHRSNLYRKMRQLKMPTPS